MDNIELIGDIDNWMDFRDMLIEHLKACDNELKFERLLEGLLLAIHTNLDSVNAVREKVGIKKMSKDELKKLKDDLNNKENKV